MKVGVNSGYLIDRLTFYTNLGHQYGPYGGPGGGSDTALPPDEEHCLHGHLAFIKGKVVHTDYQDEFTFLTFVWGYFDYTTSETQKLRLKMEEQEEEEEDDEEEQDNRFNLLDLRM